MPTALIDAVSCPQPPSHPPRKQWSRREYALLEASGVLAQQRLELVHGDLISKMGKKRPYVNALSLLYLRLVETFGTHRVNPEAPVDAVPEDNPTNEPDLIVLTRDLSHFTSANPRPDQRGSAAAKWMEGVAYGRTERVNPLAAPSFEFVIADLFAAG